jgi:hypothetical protein
MPSILERSSFSRIATMVRPRRERTEARGVGRKVEAEKAAAGGRDGKALVAAGDRGEVEDGQVTGLGEHQRHDHEADPGGAQRQKAEGGSDHSAAE